MRMWHNIKDKGQLPPHQQKHSGTRGCLLAPGSTTNWALQWKPGCCIARLSSAKVKLLCALSVKEGKVKVPDGPSQSMLGCSTSRAVLQVLQKPLPKLRHCWIISFPLTSQQKCCRFSSRRRSVCNTWMHSCKGKPKSRALQHIPHRHHSAWNRNVVQVLPFSVAQLSF